MPTTSQVGTTLSADNSQYKSVMNDSEQAAMKAGKGIFKHLDLRDAMRSVAVVVGLSIEKIAESAARAWTGFSKEAEENLKKIEELSGRTLENVQRHLANRRTTAQSLAKEEADMNSLMRERATILEQESIRRAELAAKYGEDYVKRNKDLNGIKATEAELLRLQEIGYALSEKQLIVDDLKEKKKSETAAKLKKFLDDGEREYDQRTKAAEDEAKTLKKMADQKEAADKDEIERLKTIRDLEAARVVEIEKQLVIKAKLKQLNDDASAGGFKGDKGAMYLLGGERNYNSAGDQLAYEKATREDTIRQIDFEIAEIDRRISTIQGYAGSGARTGVAYLPDLQARANALRNRKQNVDRFLFDPNYSDSLGKSVPGQQRAIIGGENVDYVKAAAEGIAQLNKTLKAGIPTVFTGGTS